MKTYIEYKEGKVSYCIKQPNRRDKDEAEIFYASKIGDYVKRGVLTKAMLLKQYEDTGGLMSEDDAKNIQVLKRKMLSYQNDLTKFELKKRKLKKDQLKIDEIHGKLSEVFSELQDYESFHENIFSQTAENLAKNNLILWWITQTFYNKDGEDWEKVFASDDYEENLDLYDELTEEENDVKNAVYKASSLVAIWVSSSISTPEEFREALHLIDNAKSDSSTESD